MERETRRFKGPAVEALHIGLVPFVEPLLQHAQDQHPVAGQFLPGRRVPMPVLAAKALHLDVSSWATFTQNQLEMDRKW